MNMLSLAMRASAHMCRLLGFSSLFLCSVAIAQERPAPSFDCTSASALNQPLAQIICSNVELSVLELSYVIAYQAMRHSLNDRGKKELAAAAASFVITTTASCDVPPSGRLDGPPSRRVVDCIKSRLESGRQNLIAHLRDDALMEAQLTPNEAKAIQRKLKDDWFLEGQAAVDGVFGPTTRNAILQWQRSVGQRPTGFASRSIVDQTTTSTRSASAVRREDEERKDLAAPPAITTPSNLASVGCPPDTAAQTSLNSQLVDDGKRLNQATPLSPRDAVRFCDVRAASPTDKCRTAHGVRFTQLDADSAVFACAAAIANDQSNPRLLYQLGRALRKNGRLEEGLEYVGKAAQQDYTAALVLLGAAFDSGTGVKRNEAKAVELFKTAAERSNADAQRNLGISYQMGRGVAKNERLAFEWVSKAANQGYDLAQNTLGEMYRDGTGVQRDERLAAHWYRKAADQGLPDAQWNLGIMYVDLKGVEPGATQEALSRRRDEGFELIRQAANGGQANAQAYLQVMANRSAASQKTQRISDEMASCRSTCAESYQFCLTNSWTPVAKQGCSSTLSMCMNGCSRAYKCEIAKLGAPQYAAQKGCF